MKIITKRIIYSLFILLFCISVPMIWLYSSGYRLNPKKFKLEKTGMLVVESIPKNSQIFINGRLTKTKTPTKISYLLPDTYLLEIKKNGHFPWSNDIKIESNRVSFVKYLYLIQKTEPRLLLSGDISLLEGVPDENMFFILEKIHESQRLSIYNVDTAKTKELYIFPKDALLDVIEWSNNNKKALITSNVNGNKEFYVIDIDTAGVINISKNTHQTFEKIRWDRYDNTVLYGLRSLVLYKIKLPYFTTDPIISDRIDDFTTYDSAIYYTVSVGNSTFLKRKNALTSITPDAIKLPNNSLYHITLLKKDMIALIDPIHYNLYIIKNTIFDSKDYENIDENIVLQNTAKKIQMSNDGNKILFYNDYELSTFDFPSASENLLNRFSTPIKKSLWSIKDMYIIYQLNGSLYVTDENPYGKKNTHLLVQDYSVNNFWVDNKYKSFIYFDGKKGDTMGIFVYPLIDQESLPSSVRELLPLINY